MQIEETICIKCQNLFSGEKKNNRKIFQLFSAENFTQSASQLFLVIMVNQFNIILVLYFVYI